MAGVNDVDRSLDSVDLFASLHPEDRAQLAGYFHTRRYDRDTELFTEGDRADAFYIVRSGKVHIVKGRSAESRVLAILGPGHFFGEMGLIEEAPRLGSASVAAGTVLLVMTKADFDEMLAQHPLIGMQIRTEIMRRHRKNISGLMNENR